MQVQVNTDNHISSSAELKQHVAATISDALSRFGDRITRVEVHLADQNSAAKGGGHDIRCSLEARPASMSPILVTHDAATIDEALSVAVDKLEKTLEKTFDRRDDPKGRTSFAG